jgi:AcrR family transcriptional regulator
MSAFDNSPHVLRPRQQRSREALAKIVQAAEHILRTDGPDGFSIAAVAHTSGLPIANIYRRFRFREDILLALKDDITARVDRAVMEKVRNHFTCVTLGPGALNFSTGAAYALLGAMPMILITGQKGILSSKQARFQIVDVVSSMTPLTENKRVLVDELRKRVPAAIA